MKLFSIEASVEKFSACPTFRNQYFTARISEYRFGEMGSGQELLLNHLRHRPVCNFFLFFFLSLQHESNVSPTNAIHDVTNGCHDNASGRFSLQSWTVCMDATDVFSIHGSIYAIVSKHKVLHIFLILSGYWVEVILFEITSCS